MEIRIDPKWRTIGLQLSGGMDSAILGFLLVRSIRTSGSRARIKPISFDLEVKPPARPLANRVLTRLREITGEGLWLDPYEFSIPREECQAPNKTYAVRNHVKALRNLGLIDVEFVGTTKNPPPEARSEFQRDEFREARRDDPKPISPEAFTQRPLSFLDKRQIVDLYRRFDLLESLLPITASCDANLEGLIEFPCGKCWWCQERDWGLASQKKNLEP